MGHFVGFVLDDEPNFGCFLFNPLLDDASHFDELLLIEAGSYSIQYLLLHFDGLSCHFADFLAQRGDSQEAILTELLLLFLDFL